MRYHRWPKEIEGYSQLTGRRKIGKPTFKSNYYIDMLMTEESLEEKKTVTTRIG